MINTSRYRRHHMDGATGLVAAKYLKFNRIAMLTLNSVMERAFFLSNKNKNFDRNHPWLAKDGALTAAPCAVVGMVSRRHADITPARF